jgi:hypothetical protein
LRSSAACCTSAGTGGSIARSSSGSGIDDTTWLHANDIGPPPLSASTATARPPSWRTAVTGVRMCTFDPCASTRSRQRSHIIPGPNFGYWNSSISVVIDVWLRFGSTALSTAFDSDRFLMRWAAQSAWMSVAGTPHTFSV